MLRLLCLQEVEKVTAYINLSVMSHIGFPFCTMLMLLGAISLWIGAYMLRSGWKYMLCGGVITAVLLFVLQGMNDVSQSLRGNVKMFAFFGRVIAPLPYSALVLLFAIVLAAEGYLFVQLMRRRKNLLTENSIKESLDSLPDGVCFYAQDGQPLLVNKQMHHISGELFGAEILNAKQFRSALLGGDVKDGAKIIAAEPTVIAETADGKVWDFHYAPLNIKKRGMYELIAMDITEQYRLSMQLKQLNERLDGINEALHRLNAEMAALVAEKELLNAKIAIHDNIGRSLLACRTYLLQKNDERSRKDLLFMWRYVFSVMNNESSPVGEWDLLEKAAQLLNVSIQLTGELPQNPVVRTAIITAIRECLTNTANHAGGDRLFVTISEDENTIAAELTNTGKPPVGAIQESGGLKNLRRIAEEAGASMTIESTPHFLLRLKFSKGEQVEWLKQGFWL